MPTVFIDNKREKKYEELNMTDAKIRQGSFLKKKQEVTVAPEVEEKTEKVVAPVEPTVEEPATIQVEVQAEPEAQAVVSDPEPVQEPETFTMPTLAIDFGDKKDEIVEEEVVPEPEKKEEKTKKKKGLRRVLGL